MQSIITENREKIGELCRTHHVRLLSVFGSAVREDFDPERSDADLLVEFEPNSEQGFFANIPDTGTLDPRKSGLNV
jgi:predicted nucleotidyltransferase